ncbi:MAG: CRISPR-associated protein Cas4 [Nocardioides sp.]|uniref:CRISPR-associated protein Cas4 n=1 Tax=Nocardioides sp. TaxID=35761 RepID=UPI0039E57EDE
MAKDDSSDGWLLLSTLQHFAYCPTQAALIRDGVWLDNHLTVTGDAVHERVDTGGTDHRRGVRAHHRVELASHRLRIHGIADTIEEARDGSLTPVEHKLGRGAGDLFPATVQVVAQALCLEEMTGRESTLGAIFVVKERRRVPVVVADHRERVEQLIVSAHHDLRLPPSSPTYSARLCRSCSVINSCQPRGVEWR